MKDVVYVTGNPDKARLFNEMLGIELQRENIDIDEIQSLDLREVVEHKAKAAYKVVGKSVVVEDTSLVFNALNRLPGPFIKYFHKEIGSKNLCKMLDGYDDRSCVASAAMAFFDGEHLEIFVSEVAGAIASEPRPKLSERSFGWDQIFIPEGETLALSEMNDDDIDRQYKARKPFGQLADFLKTYEG